MENKTKGSKTRGTEDARVGAAGAPVSKLTRGAPTKKQESIDGISLYPTIVPPHPPACPAYATHKRPVLSSACSVNKAPPLPPHMREPDNLGDLHSPPALVETRGGETIVRRGESTFFDGSFDKSSVVPSTKSKALDLKNTSSRYVIRKQNSRTRIP